MNKSTTEKIYLAACADNNYAAPLAAMLVSVLENISADFSLEIKILDAGLSEADRKKLADSLAGYDCVLDFRAIAGEQMDFFAQGISASSYLSPAAYSRLLLPEIFPDIDRIIYLDCDLIVRGDLSVLWQVDLADSAVGAVPVLFPFYSDLLVKRFLLSPAKGFLNSGVMLCDLEKLRAVNFTEQALVWLDENKNRLTLAADQDVLNFLLSNQYQKLDLRFNQTVELFVGRGWQNTPACRYGLYSESEFLSAQKDPVIIHFDGALKPWYFGLSHPYKKLFGFYLTKTAFADWPRRFSLKRLISFYSYYLLKFLPASTFRLLLPWLNQIYDNKNSR